MSSSSETAGEVALRTDADRVREVVNGICRLQAEIDADRQSLVERGIPMQNLRSLVDVRVRDDEKALRPLVESALRSSASACVDPLAREELEQRIDHQAALQKQILGLRHDASAEGLEPQALNQLTQLIHRNPEDRGERVIAALFAYAIACGANLETIARATAELEQEPESVLPDVDREGLRASAERGRGWLPDAVLGLAIGIAVMWLFV